MLRSIFAALCAVVASSASAIAADLTISSPAFADLTAQRDASQTRAGSQSRQPLD